MAMATCYHSPASLSLSLALSLPLHRLLCLPPSLSPSFSRVLPPHDNAGRTRSLSRVYHDFDRNPGKRGVNRRLFPRKNRVSPPIRVIFPEEPRTLFFRQTRLSFLSFFFSRMVEKFVETTLEGVSLYNYRIIRNCIPTARNPLETLEKSLLCSRHRTTISLYEIEPTRGSKKKKERREEKKGRAVFRYSRVTGRLEGTGTYPS